MKLGKHRKKQQDITSGLKIKLTKFEEIQNKKIRIFKTDRHTKIKNFIYSNSAVTSKSYFNVILPHYEKREPYTLRTNGEINKDVFFDAPLGPHISYYTFTSKHAIVNDQLHIFGGWYDGENYTPTFSDRVNINMI